MLIHRWQLWKILIIKLKTTYDSVCKLFRSSKKPFNLLVFYYVLMYYSNLSLRESKSSSQEERADWDNLANFWLF